MNITGISLNHKTAEINLREALHLNEDEITDLIKILKKDLFSEGYIISTCNRTEIFGIAKNPEVNYRDIQKAIIDFKPVNGISEKHFQNYFSCSAIKHILSVASGIDSLMIGDSQILGQMKNAFLLADNNNFAGSVMRKIFESAIRTGKRAITETSIGEGAVTVSYAAIQMIDKVFASLDTRKALVIGAGETGELAITHLKDKNISKIVLTNRTLKRSQEIATTHNIEILEFDKLSESLYKYDIIVSATSANHLILSYHDILQSMKKRSGKPVCILDIALPRDVDSEVKNIDNVFYHDIDSLTIIVNQNLDRRKHELPKINKIINEEMIALFSWYNTLKVLPSIKALRSYFDDIRLDELKKIRNRVDSESYEKIEDMTRRLLGRLLHYPTARLKELAESDADSRDAREYSSFLNDIYKLELNGFLRENTDEK